jgi:RHS repeat-associated protein
VTATSDPLARLTSYTYDPAGRRTSIADALGGKVTFGYDAAGQQTSLTNPDGNTTTYAYDPLGNIATTTDPLGRITKTTYNAAGQLVSRTDGRGMTTTYGNDAAGELTSQNAPGVPVSYTYDALGRRATMSDVTGTTTYGYDAASRTTSIASPQGTVSYTYDNAGQRTNMTSPSGHTVTYGYDPAGNLTSVKDWLTNTITYGYDADNRPASITRQNGVATAFTYDGAGHLIDINHNGPGGTLGNYTYTYDAAGNRTSFTSKAGTETYALDNLNRLTKATYPNGDVISYTYDPAGNRTSEAVSGVTTSATFDKANELTKNGTTAYTYDSAGNISSAGANTFTWNSAGNLASSTTEGTTTSYTYNGDGERASATTGSATTPYLWDSQAPIPELISDGTTSYVQTPNGLQEQIGPSNTAIYPLADALGSIRTITGATGSPIGTAAYDAFGTLRGSSGTTTIFGFTGQQTDSTGLLYLHARYFDPATGRFLSPDTVKPSGPGTQGYNQYVYAANNPATLTDPTGNTVAEVDIQLEADQPAAEALSRYLLFRSVTSGVQVGGDLEGIGQAINWLGLLLAGLAGAGTGVVVCYLTRCGPFSSGQTTAPAPSGTGAQTLISPTPPRPNGELSTSTIASDIRLNATVPVSDSTATLIAETYQSELATAQARACGRGSNPLCLVFVSGGDVSQATQHDSDAISSTEWPAYLHRAPRQSSSPGNVPGVCPSPRPIGMDCDEYPFATTEEGGLQNYPSLRLIDSSDNRRQGAYLYSRFYRPCTVSNGEGFIVAPINLPSVPTFGVCLP